MQGVLQALPGRGAVTWALGFALGEVLGTPGRAAKAGSGATALGQGTSPWGLGQLHGSPLPLGGCSWSLPPRGPAAFPSLTPERFVVGVGSPFPPSQQLEPCTQRPPRLLPSHLQASSSLGLCGLPLLPAGRSRVFPCGQTPAHEDLRCCPVSS